MAEIGGQDPGQILKVASVRQLATVLGVSKTKAAELAKEPWFPPRGTDGSWSVPDVRREVESRSKPTVGPSSNPLIAAVEARTMVASAALGSDAEILLRATDPLEVARASMRVASKRLGVEGGDVSEKLDDIKRALEELRRCEAGYLELAKERGKLIERDVAKACMGQLGARFVGALGRIEARLALQVEVWGSDPAFRALAPEDRARKVRQWIIESSTAARQVEALDMERMIVAELADRKP